MGIEQLVILVLIALISLINWMVRKSGEARARRKAEREESPDESFHAREESEPLVTRSAPENESGRPPSDKSMRQLMEALGVELPEAEAPEVASPPPPLPSLLEMASQFESRGVRDDGPNELIWGQRRALAKALPKPSMRKPAAPSKGIGRLLASPGGLRNGIVLSEILGPSKALRQE